MYCRDIESAKLSLLVVLVLFLSSCRKEETLFVSVSSKHSGITFNNLIIENDSVNQLDNENVYNGAGAGIGDFNNDGLQDIYLTGNLVDCKLYINKGNFRFNDVTEEAGVTGNGKWCRGVSVVDINNDGWLDIYVAATQKKNPEERKNLLYINQGINSNNVPYFVEKASAYGLDDNSHTTQANFFDYDNDGDLDVYLVVNEITPKISPYLFRPVLKNGNNPSTGKLYRNDWNSGLGHAVFTDVSKQAGIQTEGYSHSAIITDINRDGWKDIYVGNDFLTNDLLWINNGDGTFRNELNKYFRHTSANSMGNDVTDINNDGLMDVISLDMNPEDNYRKKMMLPANSYQNYQNIERFGYNYQYIRNVLQLNQGYCLDQNDSTCRPVFSEIGYFAGITATDWSWTPVVADFDNDGYRDIIISNGFPKDVTDHDFAMFRVKGFNSTPKEVLLKQIPEVKIHNYAFRNNSDLTFTDVSNKWGMDRESFSNGAAWADFDNDGDLDLIINNINDEATLYRNYSRENDKGNNNFLRVKLSGDERNIQGLGAWIEVWYDGGKRQSWENTVYRGYLTSMENIAHFGLGEVKNIDSVCVKWPSGKMQAIRDVPANTILIADIRNADMPYSHEKPSMEKALFADITSLAGIKYVHKEEDFADFNIQKLLPHKFSEYGPSIAAGDINGDGLDDLVCGGSAKNSAVLLLQQDDGRFTSQKLLPENSLESKTWDDAGILLFDADSDGDKDLYIASGGYENESNNAAYRDHFYLNDGKGNFTEDNACIPVNVSSKSCVRAADYDRDGDPDLFAAGRVDPWHYPKPVSGYIFRNDSENGTVKFTDVTQEIAGDLVNIGMICDALFTDFDNDGWTDLIIAGEWMPLVFLKNVRASFRNVSSETGINNKAGWWTSLSAGDFDSDGDMDYIAGNSGLNTFYKASGQYPVSVYASDFDLNGSYDAFTSIFLAASQDDSAKKEYPVHGRDDAVKQMISMRSRFQNYKSYAVATIDKLFSEEQLQKSLVLQANYLESSYCRNDGNGRFTLIPLPSQAQFSTLNGMVVDDFDGDTNLDVIFNTNDYGTEVSVGRYDALSGLMLRGDGRGNFLPLTIAESGIYIPGNGKALVALRGADGKFLLAAGQNRGPLILFGLKENRQLIRLLPGDVSAEILYTDGKIRKAEFYNGCSFLSQSSGFIIADEKLKSIRVREYSGNLRTLEMLATTN